MQQGEPLWPELHLLQLHCHCPCAWPSPKLEVFEAKGWCNGLLPAGSHLL